MNNKNTLILTHDLKPGMILADDLICNEVKLINKDTTLDSKNIKKITDIYPFSFISVYNVSQQEVLDEENKIYIERYKRMDDTFQKLDKQLENIFKQVNHSVKPDMHNVKELSHHIITQINDYGMAIKNIVDYNKINEFLYKHCLNVSVLSSMIGRWMGLNEKDLMLLTYSAILHDIGKTELPNDIINKYHNLTTDESHLIQKHCVNGYKILLQTDYIDESVRYGVLMHHERIDGSGYPFNLRDNHIHAFAKIIALADTFDIMTHDMENKKCSLYILEEIRDLSFSKLDPNCCSTFLAHVADYYIGEKVKLNNGATAKIVQMNVNSICKPLVQINTNFIDLATENKLFIESIV